MSDIFISTCLVLGGAAWTVIYMAAALNDPMPSARKVPIMFFVGPAIVAIGLAWWIYLLFSWIA